MAQECSLARGDRAEVLDFWVKIEVQLGKKWHGRASWHGVAVLKLWPVKNVGHDCGVFVEEMCLGVWKGVGQQA